MGRNDGMFVLLLSGIVIIFSNLFLKASVPNSTSSFKQINILCSLIISHCKIETYLYELEFNFQYILVYLLVQWHVLLFPQSHHKHFCHAMLQKNAIQNPI